MPTTEDYRTLPFKEAIDFYSQKVNVPTNRWDDLMDTDHDAAFMVAGAKGALLQDIRAEVDKALKDGTSREEFKKQFAEIVDRRGWNHTGDKDWRAAIIYQTNLRQGYAEGRCRQMTDPDVASARPYWMWIHGHSVRPRLNHLALSGKVFASNAPMWSSMFPPCGFGCKCTAVSLSARDIKRRGLEVAPSPSVGDVVEVKDERGNTKQVSIGPDRGFAKGCKFQTQEERDKERQQTRQEMLNKQPEDVRREMVRGIATALGFAAPVAATIAVVALAFVPIPIGIMNEASAVVGKTVEEVFAPDKTVVYTPAASYLAQVGTTEVAKAWRGAAQEAIANEIRKEISEEDLQIVRDLLTGEAKDNPMTFIMGGVGDTQGNGAKLIAKGLVKEGLVGEIMVAPNPIVTTGSSGIFAPIEEVKLLIQDSLGMSAEQSKYLISRVLEGKINKVNLVGHSGGSVVMEDVMGILAALDIPVSDVVTLGGVTTPSRALEATNYYRYMSDADEMQVLNKLVNRGSTDRYYRGVYHGTFQVEKFGRRGIFKTWLANPTVLEDVVADLNRGVKINAAETAAETAATTTTAIVPTGNATTTAVVATGKEAAIEVEVFSATNKQLPTAAINRQLPPGVANKLLPPAAINRQLPPGVANKLLPPAAIGDISLPTVPFDELPDVTKPIIPDDRALTIRPPSQIIDPASPRNVQPLEPPTRPAPPVQLEVVRISEDGYQSLITSAKQELDYRIRINMNRGSKAVTGTFNVQPTMKDGYRWSLEQTQEVAAFLRKQGVYIPPSFDANPEAWQEGFSYLKVAGEYKGADAPGQIIKDASKLANAAGSDLANAVDETGLAIPRGIVPEGKAIIPEVIQDKPKGKGLIETVQDVVKKVTTPKENTSQTALAQQEYFQKEKLKDASPTAPSNIAKSLGQAAQRLARRIGKLYKTRRGADNLLKQLGEGYEVIESEGGYIVQVKDETRRLENPFKKMKEMLVNKMTKFAYSEFADLPIEELETAIRNKTYEVGGIYDQKGKQILLRSHESGDEVNFLDTDYEKMKGNVVTHNHPLYEPHVEDYGDLYKGTSFSEADIQVAAYGEVDEIRAVTSGWNHSMKPKGKWADADIISQANTEAEAEAKAYASAILEKARNFNREYMRLNLEPTSELGKRYLRRADQLGQTFDRLTFEAEHEVMRRLAKKINAIYSRRRNEI